jgi:hypothetical protein
MDSAALSNLIPLPYSTCALLDRGQYLDSLTVKMDANKAFTNECTAHPQENIIFRRFLFS